MERNKKTDVYKLVSIFAYLYLVLEILRFIFGDNPLFRCRYIIPFIIIFFSVLLKRGKILINCAILRYFICWLFLGAIPCGLYNHNISVETVFVQSTYMIIAYILLVHPENYINTEKILIGFHIYFFIQLLVYKTLVFAFDYTSENYVSIFYIIFITILAIQSNKVGKKINLIHPMIALLFSLFAQGRGGILVLLMLNLFLILNTESQKKKVLLFLWSGFALLFGVLMYIESSGILANMLSKFNELGLNSNGRAIFWSNYIKECGSSITKIFFGVNVGDNLAQYESYIPKHLHNSFLSFYSKYGLFISILTLWYLFRSVVILGRKKSFTLLGVVIAFLCRAFTDLVFGGFLGDIVLYCLVFMSLQQKKVFSYEKNKGQ